LIHSSSARISELPVVKTNILLYDYQTKPSPKCRAGAPIAGRFMTTGAVR
jgi:hypothetical protein